MFFAGIFSLFVICLLMNTSIAPAHAGKMERLSTAGVTQPKIDTSFSALTKKVLETADGELDSAFNVAVDSSPGNARAAAIQPDGKVIIGGYFKTLNGLSRRGVARLNADNSIDPTFTADINGTIFALALQPNGKIIVGGDFTAVGGTSRNRIARLNADGSLDATFNPGNGADNIVYDVLVQPDGKILLGGSFYGVNSTAGYLVARLDQNGAFDASFKSPFTPSFFGSGNAPPNVIYSIALQSNGKIVVGGTPGFTSIGGDSTFIITSIARLNADGTIDSSFKAASIGGSVEKVLAQPDDKILIGGSFVTINGVSRRFVARLNADGSLDASFNPGTGGNLPVHSIFLKPDGKILIGGDFSTFNGNPRSKIAQLNADGSLDNSFVPSGVLFGTVQNVVSLPNGKALAAGSFQVFFDASRDSIAVFNADGSLDTSAVFTTTAVGGVRTIATQTDGKIIIGGNFNRVAGAQRDYVARLNADGSLLGESTGGFFSSSSIGGQVNSIVVQPDGKILVAGFNLIVRTSTGSSTSIRVGGSIMRLNANGSPDDSFVPGNIPSRRGINAAALQPDGKIIVVWGYAASNGFPSGGSSGGIARLNADGSLDSTFYGSIPQLFLNSVVIQPDGKILIGGQFGFGYISGATNFNAAYNGVIRLNSDGSVDTTFVPATTSDSARFTNVYALALQADGKILIGGSIFTGGRTTPTGAARLNANGSLDTTFDSGSISGASDGARVEAVLPLPNGKILIGGLFNKIGIAAQNNIARLNADGSPDSSFNAAADNVVYDLALQADGKILIGGDFETVNGAARTSIARLLSEPQVTRRTLFDYDGDGKADVSVFRPPNGVWYLLNSNTGFASRQFGISTDKIVPADYDGDGRTDIAVYRDNTWLLQRSGAGFASIQFGKIGDIPVPADFDGDGKAELVVYRPSNGFWYSLNLVNNQFVSVQFGTSEDKPAAGDYDGDDKTDYAVYRPSNGVWYLLRSTRGFGAVQFGISTDKPVVGDYDGDGKSDQAVFRPANGTWYINQSVRGFSSIQFGLSTDLPTPADYDGDGKTDVAVFRPSNGGNWYINRSTLGFSAIQFGSSDDKPTPNAFVP